MSGIPFLQGFLSFLLRRVGLLREIIARLRLRNFLPFTEKRAYDRIVTE